MQQCWSVHSRVAYPALIALTGRRAPSSSLMRRRAAALVPLLSQRVRVHDLVTARPARGHDAAPDGTALRCSRAARARSNRYRAEW